MARITLTPDERLVAAEATFRALFDDEPNRTYTEKDRLIGARIIDRIIRVVNKQRQCRVCDGWWDPTDIAERWPTVLICIQCWDTIRTANKEDTCQTSKS